MRAPDAASPIAALVQLNGVALRTATAILHWLCPNQYPILDYRVVSALGAAGPPDYENVAFYQRISAEIMNIASRHALDLRTVDRAMWAWDKDRG